jgi:hypothetical protein
MERSESGEMITSELITKLKSAALCLREGNDRDVHGVTAQMSEDEVCVVDIIAKHLMLNANESQVIAILDVVSSICNKDSDSYDIGINSSDLLGVALHIPCIVQKVIIRYVHGLISNFISGRSAVYCVSYIQSYMLESMRSKKIGELTLLVDICGDITDMCLNALTADKHDTNKDGSISVSYIDLIPTVINTLSRIEQTELWKKGGYAGGGRREHLDILGDICSSHWPAQLVLPLANIIADMWTFLLPRHVTVLKVM